MEQTETLEARWFLSDEDPRVFTAGAWFEFSRREPPRIDHYLVTAFPDMGIKARLVEQRPRLETKYRIADIGPTRLTPNVEAHLEQWRKISFEVPCSPTTDEDNWQELEKMRHLRLYAFVNGGVIEAQSNHRLEAGCILEWTSLRYRRLGEPWAQTTWTLAFEAFGPTDDLRNILEATANDVFHRGLSLELAATESMSYPEWLYHRESIAMTAWR